MNLDDKSDIKDELIRVLRKIDSHEYINLWKRVRVVPTSDLLENLVVSNLMDSTVLYITSKMHREYPEYRVIRITPQILIDLVHDNKRVDTNLTYVLQVSESDLVSIQDMMYFQRSSRVTSVKEFTESHRYRIHDSNSRYSNLDRIVYTDGEEVLESMHQVVVPKTSDDKYHKVSAKDENRLDLVSWHYYGTPRYWWVIAYASNVYNPLNIPIGTILRIPSSSTVRRLSS